MPRNMPLVDAVAEVLRLSTDCACRIGSKTPLVLDEVQALYQTYNLSPDGLLQTLQWVALRQRHHFFNLLYQKIPHGKRAHFNDMLP